MNGSSTPTVAMGTESLARRNSPQPPTSGVSTPSASATPVRKDGEDVRQGKRGGRMLYVLTASVLLLLIIYALIGLFSDTLLVADLTAPANDAAVPGPTEAQEAVITGGQ